MRGFRGFVCSVAASAELVRQTGRKALRAYEGENRTMSTGMFFLAVVLAGLGVYLLYALVNPEKF